MFTELCHKNASCSWSKYVLFCVVTLSWLYAIWCYGWQYYKDTRLYYVYFGFNVTSNFAIYEDVILSSAT